MSAVRKTSMEELALRVYTDRSGVKTDHLTVYTSDDDAPAPIQVGIFRMRRSDQAMTFHHEFDEGKYVVEGEVTMVDQDSGQVTVASAGDMIHIKAGTSLVWWTASSATIFFCGASDVIGASAWDGELAVSEVQELNSCQG